MGFTSPVGLILQVLSRKFWTSMFYVEVVFWTGYGQQVGQIFYVVSSNSIKDICFMLNDGLSILKIWGFFVVCHETSWVNNLLQVWIWQQAKSILQAVIC